MAQYKAKKGKIPAIILTGKDSLDSIGGMTKKGVRYFQLRGMFHGDTALFIREDLLERV